MSFDHLDDQQPFVPDDAFRAAALDDGRRRRRRRRRLSAAAGSAAVSVFAVALLVILTVPRGADPGRVDVPPTTSMAPTTTSTTSPTSTTTVPGPTTTPTTSLTTTTTTTPRAVPDGYELRTPSGNITCVLGGGVRCDIAEFTYQPTPQPADCPLDWGYSVRLLGDGRGDFNCSSDTHLGRGEVLPYGSSVRAGETTCTVEVDGVTCTRGVHGFFLSRGSYRFF